MHSTEPAVTASPAAAPRRRLAGATLYCSGMLQGLTLVSFPASSGVLKAMHGFTDAQYGAIFLPQVAAAVIGALASAGLAARLGLRAVLWIALAVNGLSQLLLAGTAALPPAAAFYAVFLGTACLGLGFGLSGAPLNAYPPLFFPRRRDSALVALHSVVGLGLALGPILANRFIAAEWWVGLPWTLAVLALVLVAATLGGRFPPTAPAQAARAAPGAAPQRASAVHPARAPSFRLFVGIAVLYALAEGTFGNWAVVYLQEVKRLPQSVAASALSAFWAAIVAGRLLVALIVLRIAAPRIWLTLPLLMAGAFLLLPYASTPALGVGLFALAGLACSACFPLTIAICAQRFPAHAPWVASMLIAALMVGVGIGSYAVGLLREVLPMEALYRWSAIYPALAFVLAAAATRRVP